MDEFGERREFFRVYEIKLQGKVHEMLETAVQVGLRLQIDHVLEVVMVDMAIHTEESLEDVLYDIHKIVRK